jgi:glyoxylase I family protein
MTGIDLPNQESGHRGDSLPQSKGRGLLAHLPVGLHHMASVVKDQERTRQFFEDILGLPLVATWCERAFNSELGREIEYCHCFYGLADGSVLAFFQFAEDDVYEFCKSVPQPGRFEHFALKVDKATWEEIDARAAEAGLSRRHTNHGYCASLYLESPDKLKVEFVYDPEDVEAINAMRRADAHSEMRRWLQGDRRPNNHDRPKRPT